MAIISTAIICRTAACILLATLLVTIPNCSHPWVPVEVIHVCVMAWGVDSQIFLTISLVVGGGGLLDALSGIHNT